VHILAVVEVDRPFDHWGDESLEIIAAFAGADNATYSCQTGSHILDWTKSILTHARREHSRFLLHR